MKLTMIGAMLALLLGPGAAHAASFTVTSIEDTDGSTCGDPCTLRQAINAANASLGADTVTFSVSGTITLGSVLPVVTDTLAIDGTGQSVTLSGGGLVQVLQLASAATLDLNSLTIANGLASSAFTAGGVTVLAPSTPDAGGATLSVTGCVFSGNSTASPFSSGAIMLGSGNASLTVANSSFTGNSGNSILTAGAIFSFSSGTVTITNSTFESNSGSTGAVSNGTGSLTVSGSTFAGNSATSSGGAIDAAFAGTITNSTFYANSAAVAGGAIRFGSVGDLPELLTVTNSTFSGNTSNSSNAAGQNGAIFAAKTLALRNTIVANSTNDNCNGFVTDEGGNLSDDGTCAVATATSLAMTPAQLGPLQDNGGPTRTTAPNPGSPAIDGGVNQLAIDAGLTTDQRGTGFPRISPAGGTVDRGAFEVQVVDDILPTCTVTATPHTLLLPNHRLIDITTNVIAIDDQPGVTFTLTSVTSSEADSGLGRNDVPLDIQGWSVGSAGLAGRLRSERFSTAGRTYTITYEARDAAGNSTTCSATVTVPRDQLRR